MLNVGQTQEIKKLVAEHRFDELDEYLRIIYMADNLKIVPETIKNDPELFKSYQANIAVQFQDEVERYKGKHNKKHLTRSDIHIISNSAAKNFLDLWLN